MICVCITLILTSCKTSNIGKSFCGRQNIFQDCGSVSCEKTFTAEKTISPEHSFFTSLDSTLYYVLWFWFFFPFCLPHHLSLSAFLFFAFLFQLGVSFVAFLGRFTSMEEKGPLCSFSHRVLHHKETEKWTVSRGEGVANFRNSVIVILVSKLSRTDSYKMHTLYCRV